MGNIGFRPEFAVGRRFEIDYFFYGEAALYELILNPGLTSQVLLAIPGR